MQVNKAWTSLSDGEVLSAYTEHKSFDAVASIYKVSRATVHKRLQKIGYTPSQRIRLTEQHKELIRALYNQGFVCSDGQLDRLCQTIGHNKPFVCRFAKSEGLTNVSRGGAKWKLPPKPPKEKLPYVHPRGMLGKKHSEENKRLWSIKRVEYARLLPPEVQQERTLKAMKTKVERYGSVAPRKENENRSWKSGWRTIGGQHKYFRSRWEANYARVLEWRVEQGIISSWQHEPETFWFLAIKRGVRSYLPDFRVVYPDGHVEYHEVKGWMDDRSRVTIKRMAKYFPDIKLVVIDKDWFKANKNFKIVLKDWE